MCYPFSRVRHGSLFLIVVFGWPQLSCCLRSIMRGVLLFPPCYSTHFPFPFKTYLLGAAAQSRTLLPSSSFLQGTSPSCMTRSMGTVSGSRGDYPSPPIPPPANNAIHSMLGWLALRSPTFDSPYSRVAARTHVAPFLCVFVY